MAVSQEMSPDVTDVAVESGKVLRLTFEDSTIRVVDVGPLFSGPIFDDIENQGIFDQVFVDPNLGTVAWPNGADLAPDVLYHLPGVDAVDELDDPQADLESLRATFEYALARIARSQLIVVIGNVSATHSAAQDREGARVDFTVRGWIDSERWLSGDNVEHIA